MRQIVQKTSVISNLTIKELTILHGPSLERKHHKIVDLWPVAFNETHATSVSDTCQKLITKNVLSRNRIIAS